MSIEQLREQREKAAERWRKEPKGIGASNSVGK